MELTQEDIDYMSTSFQVNAIFGIIYSKHIM